MDSFWDIFLWAAIPVAVLLLAGAASAYGLTRKRPRPPENAQDRVARAYRDATSQAATGGPARQSAHRAPQVFAARTQARQPRPRGQA
jgi:hypothetical protein